MSNAPQFDVYGTGKFSSSLNTTTSIQYLILTGTADGSAVDIEININGAGWVSDPTLVGFTSTGFTIPNLSSYPSGFLLDSGVNTFAVRTVNVAGARSDEALARITQVNDTEYGLGLVASTGLTVERSATSITLKWSDTSNGLATGYNIYASTGPSGTGSGYLRVNASIIPSSSPTSVESTVDDEEVYTIDGSNSEGGTLRVTSELINPADNTVLAKKSENFYDLTLKPIYKYTSSVSRLSSVKQYYYVHNRTDSIISGVLNADVFSFVSASQPLYYVITSLFYDSSTATLRESRHSVEIPASPLIMDTTVRGINIREPSTVIQDYILEVQQVAPELSLIPGSTVREIHIEPFANEIQKAYFLMDFIHRANSFAALLNIDDPSLTGISISVANSTYKTNLKTALSTNSDNAVQSLIDSAFDNLAQNIGQPRLSASYASVNQLFYTNVRPTRNLVVAQGSIVSSSQDVTSPRFVTTSQATMYLSTIDTFYNTTTRRYEIFVQMVAEIPGSSGNVSAGALDTVQTGALNLLTVNLANAVGGRDRSSNLEVAQICMRAYSSVDTGTVNGYLSNALKTPGVLGAVVIPGGNPLMWRDYSVGLGKHLGGKVDVYIKGNRDRTVSETFAFSYTVGRNVVFKVLDSHNLIFRALDSRLSEDNPIAEMFNNQSEGLGLKNYARYPVEFYNLTGVAYLDYRTIRLNKSVPQLLTNYDDTVEGDFRFAKNEKFVMSVQPVNRVLSVTGQISGLLDSTFGYEFSRVEDPLLMGFSTKSSDSITINSYNGVPTGEMIQVNDEVHVLVGNIAEPLNSLGINIFSLNVYSADRTIRYNGPHDRNPDFLIEEGDSTHPLRIVRSAQSTISNGSSVSVDYEHEENFTVAYVTNQILQDVSARLNQTRHVTADVLVKQSLENPLSINATVVLAVGASQSVVDLRIRTAVSNLLQSKSVGGTVHISDVVSAMMMVDGVSYVVQPFARMTLKSGSIRLRDHVNSDFIFIPSLSSGFNKVFISVDPVPFNAVEGGGPDNIFHAVYLDGMSVPNSKNMPSVGMSSPQGYVIGFTGVVINGYSDDATIQMQNPNSTDTEQIRLGLTANRVLLSLPIDVNPSNDPSLHSVSVTYVTATDNSAEDVTAGSIEYLSSGDLVINYRGSTDV